MITLDISKLSQIERDSLARARSLAIEQGTIDVESEEAQTDEAFLLWHASRMLAKIVEDYLEVELPLLKGDGILFLSLAPEERAEIRRIYTKSAS